MEPDVVPGTIKPYTSSKSQNPTGTRTTMHHNLDRVDKDELIAVEAPGEDLINDFQRLQIITSHVNRSEPLRGRGAESQRNTKDGRYR